MSCVVVEAEIETFAETNGDVINDHGKDVEWI